MAIRGPRPLLDPLVGIVVVSYLMTLCEALVGVTPRISCCEGYL